MKIQSILRIFGYTVATLVGVVGIAVTAGFLMPSYIPENLRILFGIVFILYAIYRIVTLRLTRKRDTISDET